MTRLPEILDIGCGRKKFPGSLGIDMSDMVTLQALHRAGIATTDAPH